MSCVQGSIISTAVSIQTLLCALCCTLSGEVSPCMEGASVACCCVAEPAGGLSLEIGLYLVATQLVVACNHLQLARHNGSWTDPMYALCILLVYSSLRTLRTSLSLMGSK